MEALKILAIVVSPVLIAVGILLYIARETPKLIAMDPERYGPTKLGEKY